MCYLYIFFTFKVRFLLWRDSYTYNDTPLPSDQFCMIFALQILVNYTIPSLQTTVHKYFNSNTDQIHHRFIHNKEVGLKKICEIEW